MREVTTHYPFHEDMQAGEYMLVFDIGEELLLVEYTGEGSTETYNNLDGGVIRGA